MFAAPHPIIVAAWTADAPSGFGGAQVRPGLPSTTVLPSHSLSGGSGRHLLRGRRRRRPASLVATAKLNGVEPQAWLTNVLERMISRRTKVQELERLLPWVWKAERLPATVEA